MTSDRRTSEAPPPLYWHCASCGNHEPAQEEYEHGDSEPCCLCENGVARVMTLQEAASTEQRHAVGVSETAIPEPDWKAEVCAIASELGIEYVPDQGATYPGPLPSLLNEIRRLRNRDQRLTDRELHDEQRRPTATGTALDVALRALNEIARNGEEAEAQEAATALAEIEATSCVHDFYTIEADDQAGEELVKCRECGIEQTHKLVPEDAPTLTIGGVGALGHVPPISRTTLRRAANDLIDAISTPAGRDFEHAWVHACLIFGRYGAKPTLLDEGPRRERATKTPGGDGSDDP